MDKEEIWKDIKGYEGIYQVSNYGRVKALFSYNVQSGYTNKERIMKPWKKGNYLVVGLYKGKLRKNQYVHRLVASAFLEIRKDKNVVNHIDYNTENNNVDNLEWTTQKENVMHSIINMRKEKKHCKASNTNEKYISKKKNGYEVNVKRKYIGKFKTLNEAIKARDEVWLCQNQ